MTLYNKGLPDLAKPWEKLSIFSGLIFVAHYLWKLVCRRPVCASPWVLSPPSCSSRRSLGSLRCFFLRQYPPAIIRFNNTRVGRETGPYQPCIQARISHTYRSDWFSSRCSLARISHTYRPPPAKLSRCRDPLFGFRSLAARLASEFVWLPA